MARCYHYVIGEVVSAMVKSLVRMEAEDGEDYGGNSPSIQTNMDFK